MIHVVRSQKAIIYYNSNNSIHRVDGPAITKLHPGTDKKSSCYWMQNGKFMREANKDMREANKDIHEANKDLPTYVEYDIEGNEIRLTWLSDYNVYKERPNDLPNDIEIKNNMIYKSWKGRDNHYDRAKILAFQPIVIAVDNIINIPTNQVHELLVIDQPTKEIWSINEKLLHQFWLAKHNVYKIRTNDQPNHIAYNDDGTIMQAWRDENGSLRRENDLPTRVFYKDKKIIKLSWCKDYNGLMYIQRSNGGPNHVELLDTNTKVDTWKDEAGFLHNDHGPAKIVYRKGHDGILHIIEKAWYCHGFIHRENNIDSASAINSVIEDGAVMHYYISGNIEKKIFYSRGVIERRAETSSTLTTLSDNIDLPSIYYYQEYNGLSYLVRVEYYKNNRLHRANDLPAMLVYENHENIREKTISHIVRLEKWYKDGKVHRDGDLPANIQYYCKSLYDDEGKLQKVIKTPAIKMYYNNDLLHRDADKPAVLKYYEPDLPSEFGQLAEEVYYRNGLKHRFYIQLFGQAGHVPITDIYPAYITYHKNGFTFVEAWYKNGVITRDDKPAYFQYADNGHLRCKRWYKNGKICRADPSKPSEIIYGDNKITEIKYPNNFCKFCGDENLANCHCQVANYRLNNESKTEHQVDQTEQSDNNYKFDPLEHENMTFDVTTLLTNNTDHGENFHKRRSYEFEHSDNSSDLSNSSGLVKKTKYTE